MNEWLAERRRLLPAYLRDVGLEFVIGAALVVALAVIFVGLVGLWELVGPWVSENLGGDGGYRPGPYENAPH